MGPLAAPDWGEPRRTGYEDNWARYGATTDEAIAQGQHTGVADGIVHRGVSHVVLFIGQNDLHPLEPAFQQIYLGLWSGAQIETWVDGRIANLKTILDALPAGDARVVLVASGDFTAFYAFRQLFTLEAGRTRVSNAIGQLDEAMRQLAVERRLVYVDLYGFAHAVYGVHTAPESSLAVGDTPLNLEAEDNTTGDFPLAAFVDDGAHPNTIPQGILANLMIEALNVYGAGLVPLTEEELLALRGVDYGGSDTLEAELGGPLSIFVENYWSIFLDGFESGDTGAWGVPGP
jgi:hypothetical protein